MLPVAKFLKQICTDILIDEAFHIDFQSERFRLIYECKKPISKFLDFYLYKYFYFSIIILVWFVYRHTFIAGRNNFNSYWKKMNLKFRNTIGRLRNLKYKKLCPPASVQSTEVNQYSIPII